MITPDKTMDIVGFLTALIIGVILIHRSIVIMRTKDGEEDEDG